MNRIPLCSIIIPTRDEKNNLAILLPILTYLYPLFPIWIVDDNSTDGTQEFINQFARKHTRIHILLRQNKRGRGSAVIDGLRAALKDVKITYFLEMDADGSHDPRDIKKLLNEFVGPAAPRKTLRVYGASAPYSDYLVYPETKSKGSRHPQPPIVIGSRHIKGGKFVNCQRLRVVLSIFANRYARLILGIPISDYTNGFRLYSRKAVQILTQENIKEKGYAALSEIAYILYKRGFKFKEVPTTFVNRSIGNSNATVKEFLKSIMAIPRIRFSYSF